MGCWQLQQVTAHNIIIIHHHPSSSIIIIINHHPSSSSSSIIIIIITIISNHWKLSCWRLSCVICSWGSFTNILYFGALLNLQYNEATSWVVTTKIVSKESIMLKDGNKSKEHYTGCYKRTCSAIKAMPLTRMPNCSRYQHNRDLVCFLNMFSDKSRRLPTGWEIRFDKSSRVCFLAYFRAIIIINLMLQI